MKADMPHRCSGRLFSIDQVCPRYMWYWLAAKFSSDSAPKPHPMALRVPSDLFFETMRVRMNKPQKMPFMYIQSREPTGTVWWIRLRLAYLSVDIKVSAA